MYHYYFEGDTVRLAYWRIEYDTDKFMYADTTECKNAMVASLKARGFTPTATEIDQTGNEWIDGECFTDHSTVEDALSRGRKDFICDGDMEEVVNTLTIMNDAMFHVDANNVWHITVPNIPSLSCYSIMTCLTASSVDYQKISINNGPALPLYKSASEPVLAFDVVATPEKSLAIQINITDDKAFFNASANADWGVGEIKSFGYKRANTHTELLCDGSMYDKDTYPALYEAIKDTYAVPAELVQTSNARLGPIIFLRDTFVIAGDPDHPTSAVYTTTDFTNFDVSYVTHDVRTLKHNNDTIVCFNFDSYGGEYRTRIEKSTDLGKTWTTVTWSRDVAYDFAFSEAENMWSVLSVDKNGLATWYTADADFTTLTATGYTKQFESFSGQYLYDCGVYCLGEYWLYSIGSTNFIINNSVPKYEPVTVHPDIQVPYFGDGLCVKGRLLFTNGTRTLYIVGANSYDTIDISDFTTDDACTKIVYIPECDSYMLIDGSSMCAVDIDNLCLKRVSANSTSLYKLDCALYVPSRQKIFCTASPEPAEGATYTIDAENFALPPEASNAYTYIKAE